MKLNEIKSDKFRAALEWVKQVLPAGVRRGYVNVLSDGSIEAGNWIINVDARNLSNGMLPFKFHDVGSHFSITGDSSLRSLERCPIHIGGNFDISNCVNLKDFVEAPEFVDGNVNILGCLGITSFVGIHNHFKKIGGSLIFSPHCIKTGGLGLLLIPTITDFEFDKFAYAKHKRPFTIIQKYLGKPDQIFECQAELIDAGYEEYAKL